jgi:hypothetical protein
MALSDRTLAQIERNLDNLEKPTIGQLRAMLAEIRASRTELRTLQRFTDRVVQLHRLLGTAIEEGGEVR